MLRELDHDYAYTNSGITPESYDYQKEKLEGELGKLRDTEDQRRKDARNSTYGSQIAAMMKSPLEKYQQAIADIDKKTDPIFGGEGTDYLNAEQARFAKLQARQGYLQSLENEMPSGPERAAAIERGSSAAYSASFGQRAIDKTQAEMLRVEREIRDILKNNLPAAFETAG